MSKLKILLRKLRNGIKNTYRLYNIIKIFKSVDGCDKRIILIGSPYHGNLGDHAISLAELCFFKNNLSNKKVVEIFGDDYRFARNLIIGKVRGNDCIVVTGGGFIGSLWMNEENMVRDIIKSFPDNKIIIMPQTIFFEDNSIGKTEKIISQEIYNRHKHLTVFLRERASYEFAKSYFTNCSSIYLVPDMVTYLNFSDYKNNRQGILFCFRQDKEKILSNNDLNKLKLFFKKREEKIKNTTTVLSKSISLKDRNNVFLNKICEFASSKLVITDRLHGMLFSAITGTPCIALDNYSGKIKGVYEWIKYLGYIKFAEGIDDIYQNVDLLLNIGSCTYDNQCLVKQLMKISEVLSE